jgi:hypothetical protein
MEEIKASSSQNIKVPEVVMPRNKEVVRDNGHEKETGN